MCQAHLGTEDKVTPQAKTIKLKLSTLQYHELLSAISYHETVMEELVDKGGSRAHRRLRSTVTVRAILQNAWSNTPTTKGHKVD
jgi:hypothetical protein